MSGPAVFYYDLGDPACYLVAERIVSALSAEWVPVHAPGVGLTPAMPDRPVIERLAAELGLQPLRWPASLPVDSRRAALSATYARAIGRTIAFSLAAFRQAFAGGRDLGADETVMIAGAACEIHPSALIRALTTRSVQDGLKAACERARRAGVTELPAIEIDGRLIALDEALGALA